MLQKQCNHLCNYQLLFIYLLSCSTSCHCFQCKVLFSVNIHRNLFSIFAIFSESNFQLFARDVKKARKDVAHLKNTEI